MTDGFTPAGSDMKTYSNRALDNWTNDSYSLWRESGTTPFLILSRCSFCLISLMARALSFNSSGTQIITAGQIWDAATGELLLTLSNPDGVGDAEFSPDGTQVAVAGLDGLVRLYTLDLAELIELAQSRVTRSLTTVECQQYLHLDNCPGRE